MRRKPRRALLAQHRIGQAAEFAELARCRAARAPATSASRATSSAGMVLRRSRFSRVMQRCTPSIVQSWKPATPSAQPSQTPRLRTFQAYGRLSRFFQTTLGHVAKVLRLPSAETERNFRRAGRARVRCGDQLMRTSTGPDLPAYSCSGRAIRRAASISFASTDSFRYASRGKSIASNKLPDANSLRRKAARSWDRPRRGLEPSSAMRDVPAITGAGGVSIVQLISRHIRGRSTASASRSGVEQRRNARPIPPIGPRVGLRIRDNDRRLSIQSGCAGPATKSLVWRECLQDTQLPFPERLAIDFDERFVAAHASSIGRRRARTALKDAFTPPPRPSATPVRASHQSKSARANRHSLERTLRPRSECLCRANSTGRNARSRGSARPATSNSSPTNEFNRRRRR